MTSTIETEDVVAALVRGLRTLVVMDEVGSDNPLGRDAADTIERLREENVRADELAIELVMAGNKWPQGTITADEAAYEVRTARAALNQQ